MIKWTEEILEKDFVCNLSACKGACCIEGDSGAPLTDEEAIRIEKEYDTFKDFLPEKHKKEVQKQGFSVIDSDGDVVTPLVDKRQCAYSFYDKKGILKCFPNNKA